MMRLSVLAVLLLAAAVPVAGATVWTGSDLGPVALPGSHSIGPDGISVTAAGNDIWGSSDQGRLVYRTLTGDGEIVTQVADLTHAHAWSKAGVMIRASLAANSAHAFVARTGTQGIAFQRRHVAGGISSHVGGGSSAGPVWLRLRRTGDLFEAFRSVDGSWWEPIGTDTITMPATVLVGVALTSHAASTLATARFAQVGLSGWGTAPVRLLAPAAGAVLALGGTVALAAETDLPDEPVITYRSGEAVIATGAPSAAIWTPTTAGTWLVVAEATDAMGTVHRSEPVPVTVTAMPLPWITQPIGTVVPGGSAAFADETFTLANSGRDIWNQRDEFRFVYQTFSGDCQIITQVASLDAPHAWTKAGIMLRSSTSAGSPHVLAAVTGSSGVALQYRTLATGGSTHIGGGKGTAPQWLKLERRGTLCTAWRSSNGWSWTMLGTVEVDLGQTMLVGLALSSHDRTAFAHADFTNTQVLPLPSTPAIAWQSPSAGAAYQHGDPIALAVDLLDPDLTGPVTFRANGAVIATGAPTAATWSGAAFGIHQLTAEATTTTGILRVSEPRSVWVTGLPSPWISEPVGIVGSDGAGTITAAGEATLRNAGSDIWNRSDAFRFVHRPMSGDVRIQARVDALQHVHAWTKVGLMLRAGTAANAPHAFIAITGSSGVAFQHRSSTNDISNHLSGGAGNEPIWLRLERIGDELIGYRSPDGATWTEVGRTTIALGPSAQIGLALTSHHPTAYADAALSQVMVESLTTTTPLPSVTFASPALTVHEDAGSIALPLVLNQIAAVPVTVTWTVAPATATAGNDYVEPAITTTVIPVGATTADIPIILINDTVPEADETFSVTLTMAEGATLGATTTLTVTIQDDGDNAAPTVAEVPLATPAPVTGTTTSLNALGADDGGEPNLTYTWSATGPAAVTFVPNDTNAAKASTATFTAAGSYTLSVVITDAQNATVSADVSVTVLATPTAVAVAPTSSDVVREGTLQFTATVNDQFGAPIATPSVAWSVDPLGSIDANGLFTAGTTLGSTTITATSGTATGQATATVVNSAPTVATAASATPNPVTGTTATLTVLGADDAGESNLIYTWSTIGIPPATVTFSANGTNAAKETTAIFAAAGSYQLLATIRDTENLTVTSAVTVMVVAATTIAWDHDSSASEEVAGSATITARLTQAIPFEVTVGYRLAAGGTASSNNDHGLVSGTLTFPADSTDPQTITVIIVDDALHEGDETVRIELHDPSAGALLGSPSLHVLTIIDNDPAPAVAFADAASSVMEDSGTVALTVQLDAISGRDANIPYSVVGGTATADTDFVLATGTLTIPAGSTAGVITATILADEVIEADETILIALGMPTHASLGTPSVHTLTILGDNQTPVITAGPTAVLDPADPTRLLLSITVSDDGPFNQLCHAWQVTGPGDVSLFPNGSCVAANAVATVTAVGSYTVLVTVTDALGASVSASTNGVVPAVPTAAHVAPSAVDLAPGASQSFTATITDQFTTPINPTPALSWSVNPSSLGTINAVGQLTVAASATAADSGSVTASVTTAPSPVSASAAVTVVPQSTELPILAWATADGGAVTEALAVHPLPLVLSAPSTEPITVHYHVGGTATAGVDYALTSGSLTIAAGATTASMSLLVLPDSLLEGEEIVEVTLAGVSGATLGSPLTHTVTILDEDVPIVDWATSAASVIAGDTVGTRLRLRSTAPAPWPITVPYTIGGTAAAGSDHALTAGTLTLPAGATQATLAVVADAAAVDGRTIVITLDPDLISGAIVVGNTVATITIVGADAVADEPPTARLEPTPGSFLDTVTVTLEANPSHAAIWYTIDGSTPVPGAGTALRYEQPLILAATTTVRGVASLPDGSGAVTSGEYVRVSSDGFGPAPHTPPAGARQISPVCLEWRAPIGGANFAMRMEVRRDGVVIAQPTVHRLDARNAYADVPLDADGPVEAVWILRDDAGQETASEPYVLTWAVTDLAEATVPLSVRAGDSLLLTASGAGDALEIDLGGGGAGKLIGAPGQGFAARFDVPGFPQISAWIDGVDTSHRLDLAVLTAAIPTPVPFAGEVDFVRTIDATAGADASRVVFAASDSAILSVSGAGSSGSGNVPLSATALLPESASIVARVGELGPILTAQSYQGFRLDPQPVVVAATGSVLVDRRVVMTPAIPTTWLSSGSAAGQGVQHRETGAPGLLFIAPSLVVPASQTTVTVAIPTLTQPTASGGTTAIAASGEWVRPIHRVTLALTATQTGYQNPLRLGPDLDGDGFCDYAPQDIHAAVTVVPHDPVVLAALRILPTFADANDPHRVGFAAESFVGRPIVSWRAVWLGAQLDAFWETGWDLAHGGEFGEGWWVENLSEPRYARTFNEDWTLYRFPLTNNWRSLSQVPIAQYRAVLRHAYPTTTDPILTQAVVYGHRFDPSTIDEVVIPNEDDPFDPHFEDPALLPHESMEVAETFLERPRVNWTAATLAIDGNSVPPMTLRSDYAPLEIVSPSGTGPMSPGADIPLGADLPTQSLTTSITTLNPACPLTLDELVRGGGLISIIGVDNYSGAIEEHFRFAWAQTTAEPMRHMEEWWGWEGSPLPFVHLIHSVFSDGFRFTDAYLESEFFGGVWLEGVLLQPGRLTGTHLAIDIAVHAPLGGRITQIGEQSYPEASVRFERSNPRVGLGEPDRFVNSDTLATTAIIPFEYFDSNYPSHSALLGDLRSQFVRDDVVQWTITTLATSSSKTWTASQVTGGKGRSDGSRLTQSLLPGIAELDPMSGNVVVTIPIRQDGTTAPGPDLMFTYNSTDGIDCGWGPGWRTNYDVQRVLSMVIDETGRRTPASGGPLDPVWGYVSNPGGAANALFEDDGSALARQDNWLLFFDADGWLKRKVSIRGETLVITRDPETKRVTRVEEIGGAGRVLDLSTAGLTSLGIGIDSVTIDGKDFPVGIRDLIGDSGSWSFLYDEDTWTMSSATLQGTDDHGHFAFVDGQDAVRITLNYLADKRKHGIVQAVTVGSPNGAHAVTTTLSWPNPENLPNSLSLPVTVTANDGASWQVQAGTTTLWTRHTDTGGHVHHQEWTTSFPSGDPDFGRGLGRRLTRWTGPLTGGPGFNETIARYDAGGNLVESEQKLSATESAVTTYAWTNLRDQNPGIVGARLISEVRQIGVQLEHDDSGVDLVTSIRYADSVRKTGLPVRQIDPCGAVINWDYNDQGHLMKVIDARGATTVFSDHTDAGDPLTVIDPLGRKTTMTRDGRGAVATVKDRYDFTTEVIRNAAQMPTIQKLPQRGTALERAVTDLIDPLGNVTQTTDTEGRTIQVIYDRRFRVVRREAVAGSGGDAVVTSDPLVAAAAATAAAQPVPVVETHYDQAGLPAGYWRMRMEVGGISQRTVIMDALGRTRETRTPIVLQPVDAPTAVSESVVTYQYDSVSGFLTGMTDPRNAAWVTTITSDLAGRQIGSMTPSGIATTTTLNTVGWTLAQTLVNHEQTTRMAYDACGRVLRTTNPAGGVTVAQYDLAGNLLSTDSGAGRGPRREINAAGEVANVTDAFGATTHQEWDANEPILRTISQRGPGQLLTHEQLLDDRALATTFASKTGSGSAEDDVAVIMTLRNDGTPQTAPSTLGAEQRFRVDGHGRSLQTAPQQWMNGQLVEIPQTVTGRNNLGQVVASAHGLGRHNESVTDATGAVIAQKDNAQATDGAPAETSVAWEVVERDLAGRTLVQRQLTGDPNPAKQYLVQTMTYDQDGRLKTQTMPGRGTRRIDYSGVRATAEYLNDELRASYSDFDAFNQAQAIWTAGEPSQTVIRETDAYGRVWRQQIGDEQTVTFFDARTGVSTGTRTSTGLVRLERDTAGRVVAIVDAEGRTVHTEYDARDRVIARTHPDGRRETMTYVKDTHLVHTHFNGVDTTQVHDYAPDGFRTQMSTQRGSEPAVVTAYARSIATTGGGVAKGVISTVTQNGQTQTMISDRVGRSVSIQYPGQDAITTTYDRASRRVTHGDKSYTYNAGGLVETMTQAGTGATVTFGYTAEGWVSSVSLPHGVTRTYDHDLGGRITAMTQLVGLTAEPWSVTRDTQGRVTSMTGPDSTRSFTYRQQRLVRERRTGEGAALTLYRYDASGNRIAQSTFAEPVAQNLAVTAGTLPTTVTVINGTWTAPANHQLAVTTTTGTAMADIAQVGTGEEGVAEQTLTITLGSPLAGTIAAGYAIEGTAFRYHLLWQRRPDGFSDLEGRLLIQRVDRGTELATDVAVSEWGTDAPSSRPLRLTWWPDGSLEIATGPASSETAISWRVGTTELPSLPNQTSVALVALAADGAASASATFSNVQWSVTTTGRAAWTAIYNAANELVSRVETGTAGTATEIYQYSPAGELTQLQRTGYNPQTIQYGYDAFNRRTSQTVQNTQGTATYGYAYDLNTWRRRSLTHPNGDVTAFAWDGQDLIRETTLAGGAGSTTQGYFNHRGQPLWQHGTTPVSVTVYGRDLVGDITGHIVPASLPDEPLPGMAVYARKFRHDAFGVRSETLRQVEFGGVVSYVTPTVASFGPSYKGQYQDPAGDIYLRHRYYLPQLGAFGSVDPAKAGGNWYAYADGDPVNKWDPLGLAAYFFDGTANHPMPANVDKSPNFKTNVRHLFEAYIGDAFYAYGIGSGYDPAGRLYSKDEIDDRHRVEQATGRSMHERVNWMLGRLDQQLAKGDNVVEVFGFSRGAASALEFLNRIDERRSSGDPKYQNIEVRFVGLFDVVSAMRSSVVSEGRAPNYIRRRPLAGDEQLSAGWVESIRGSIFPRKEYKFDLPPGLNYTNIPIHVVAMDEQRTAFQVTDVQGALQVGFRGVHSDVGGGYGPSNVFEWQPRDFMIQRARLAGLRFRQGDLDAIERPSFVANKFAHWQAGKGRNGEWKNYIRPTDNSQWYYNDNEQRTMPKGLIIHSATGWHATPVLNAWTAPTFSFDGGALPSVLPPNTLGTP